MSFGCLAVPLENSPTAANTDGDLRDTNGMYVQAMYSFPTGTDLAAGDFVRWVKQVIDLLDQLAKIPGLEPRLARLCSEAIKIVRRGVVAYSTVV